MFGIQVRDMNKTIRAAVASAQMSANSVLSDFGLRVIAVVQNHELCVTKDILNWVIVGTAFGQADPVQLKLTHDLTSAPRLAWMSTVLVKGNPNCGCGIPVTKATHKLAHVLGAFAGQKHPMHLSTSGIVTDE